MAADEVIIDELAPLVAGDVAVTQLAVGLVALDRALDAGLEVDRELLPVVAERNGPHWYLLTELPSPDIVGAVDLSGAVVLAGRAARPSWGVRTGTPTHITHTDDAAPAPRGGAGAAN